MNSKDAVQPLSNEDLAATVGGTDFSPAYITLTVGYSIKYDPAAQASVATGALLNQFSLGSPLSGLTAALALPNPPLPPEKKTGNGGTIGQIGNPNPQP